LRSRTWTTIAAVGIAWALLANPAVASHFTGSECDGGIPPEETLGFRSFPRGDVFCSFLADPKSSATFASYLNASSTSPFKGDVGAIGVGDRFGLIRWNGPSVGEGVQLSFDAAVLAQFDLDIETFDLLNADYVVGLPLTFRRGPFSTRLRVYHQSSHLGDQIVLEMPEPKENFAFEAGEAMLSLDVSALRLYAGGELVFNERPEEVHSSGVAHGGIELRQRGALFPAGQRNRVRLVAALDVKAAERRDWTPAWSARAGFEIGRTPGAEHLSRPWRLLAEFYDGPSPYGFFTEEVTAYGIGLHLGE
jgi:hypothetical protein